MTPQKKTLKTKSAEKYKTLGNTFLEQGKILKAIACYRKALLIDPHFAAAHNNLGVAFQRQGKLKAALASLKKALEINPQYAEAHNNLGTVFQNQGKLGKAAKSFKKALRINPRLAQAHYNLGTILNEEYRLEEAIASFQEALTINPDYAKAHNNLGVALRNQGRLEEAETAFKQAVDLNPDDEAYYNLGIVCQDENKAKEAIGCFEHAVRLNPDHQGAYANLINQMEHLGDWSRIDELKADSDKLTQMALAQGTKPGETPFMSLSWYDNPQRHLLVARLWSQEISQRVSAYGDFLLLRNRRKKSRKKIRIGYLSNNFHDHPVGELLISLFKSHHRKKFKIFLYSYGHYDSRPYRSQIKGFYDQFVDIKNLSHPEAVKRIFKDGVDILVDLNGHTQGNRLEICALRPAPIQVSYLGFLGTTGADFFDYLITDRIVTPEDQSPFYTEQFVYLPGCYQISHHPRLRFKKTLAKTDFGLPQNAFVFCCFNNAYKIEPVIFVAWMRILKKVPQSILWLWRSNQPALEENLRDEARRKKIDPNRLIFADNLPLKEHLRRLQVADLALDTRIYNGGVTTTNALWAGVPVITLQGKHFASRISSSMLTAIGLKQLITKNLKEYEALAVGLAKNPKELNALRSKLNANKLTQPLFDTQKFVANLEKAYHLIWDNYLSGKKPCPIKVNE